MLHNLQVAWNEMSSLTSTQILNRLTMTTHHDPKIKLSEISSVRPRYINKSDTIHRDQNSELVQYHLSHRPRCIIKWDTIHHDPNSEVVRYHPSHWPRCKIKCDTIYHDQNSELVRYHLSHWSRCITKWHKIHHDPNSELVRYHLTLTQIHNQVRHHPSIMTQIVN